MTTWPKIRTLELMVSSLLKMSAAVLADVHSAVRVAELQDTVLQGRLRGPQRFHGWRPNSIQFDLIQFDSI